MISTGPVPPRSRRQLAGGAPTDPTVRTLEHHRLALPDTSSLGQPYPRLGQPDAARLLPTLSRREREVLRLLAYRYTDREIADLLCISYRTVTTHVANIFAKLGISSRRDAATLVGRRDDF
jgi:DNA-binding CsgD family transcriptional regulator